MKRNLGTWTYSLMALAAALACAFPFFWMLLAAFKSNAEIFRPLSLWPASFSPRYFAELSGFQGGIFWRQFLNSLLVSTLQTMLVLSVASMAGYAYVSIGGRWRGPLILAAACSLVLPMPILMIPMFEWWALLGLADSRLAVVLQGMVSGLGLLFLVQAYKKVPRSMFELARIEGAGEWRVFLLTLPLVRPYILAYGLLHFIISWQEHLVPMVLLQSDERMTLTVGLSMMYGRSLTTNMAVLMAGSLLTIIPVLALFAWQARNLRSALRNLQER